MGRHKKIKEEVKESFDEETKESEQTLQEEEENIGKVEAGSLNDHVSTAEKGIKEFKIWKNLTEALIAMAQPNEYHRINLSDKEMLKKIEEKYGQKIDYNVINSVIIEKPWIIEPNGVKQKSDIPQKEEKVTKKQEKINKKKEKIQKKIDIFQSKLDKIKNKECPRADKIRNKIQELETKMDRIDFK